MASGVHPTFQYDRMHVSAVVFHWRSETDLSSGIIQI